MTQDKDLYLLLGELNGRVGQVLEMVTSIARVQEDQSNKINAIDQRITTLEAGKEASKANLAIVFSVVSALITGFGVFWKFIHG